MDKRDNILESWIMVEHLSEGDINLRDKTIFTLNELQENNFFDLFTNEIKKKIRYSNETTGKTIAGLTFGTQGFTRENILFRY